jgi:hypothetical protein
MYDDLMKNKSLYTLAIPKTTVPIAADTDYDTGFIERYFTQKANDVTGIIHEIDKDTYNGYLKNPYWISVKMRWRITGPLETTYNMNGGVDDIGVKKSNTKSIQIVAEKLKNISLYLPNLLQYYRK